MRQSSSRDNLLRSKHGVNDESASYGALNTKREKKITVSEVDSSLRGGRHEHSISDMSVQMKQFQGFDQKQLLNTLKN